jgi:xanthine/uracil permease
MAVGLSAAEDHPVDEVLPFGQMFVYGLQHVLSMYAGVVAVPLIVGTAFKLSGPEITIDLPPQPEQQGSETPKQ